MILLYGGYKFTTLRLKYFHAVSIILCLLLKEDEIRLKKESREMREGNLFVFITEGMTIVHQCLYLYSRISQLTNL